MQAVVAQAVSQGRRTAAAVDLRRSPGGAPVSDGAGAGGVRSPVVVVVVGRAPLARLRGLEVAELLHSSPVLRVADGRARARVAVDLERVVAVGPPVDGDLVAVRELPVAVRAVLRAHKVVVGVAAELDVERAALVLEGPLGAAARRPDEAQLRGRQGPDRAHAAPVVRARRVLGRRRHRRALQLPEHGVRDRQLVVAVLAPGDADLRAVAARHDAPARVRRELGRVEDAAGPQADLELAAGVLEAVPGTEHGARLGRRLVELDGLGEGRRQPGHRRHRGWWFVAAAAHGGSAMLSLEALR
mmetsp:Transcript_26875/g.88834  ORF Transcript_26875/g.88834 Transcript_26875/m.88834 type:complete len:301 (-) Transcript_26875:8-910(-)